MENQVKLEKYHIVYYPTNKDVVTTGVTYRVKSGVYAMQRFYSEFPNAIFVGMYIPENTGK